MSAHNSVEIEIKVAVESAAKARALLREHRFRLSKRRIFERNLVLDDNRKSLLKSGRLLRVREAGNKVTCTFKGRETAASGRHKQRRENEFQASDPAGCLALFGGLGYNESFRYEKFRTEFQRKGESGTATLDETPIGVFMELEGPTNWINQTAKTLGFTRDRWLSDSYGKLYFDWCKTRGIKPTNMIFDESPKN